jgi:hypothetical protein
MTIRRCITYRNDLRGTLTSRSNNCPDKKILFKKQLFDLEVKGHYGTWHAALWSCTHIPNIIDLSWNCHVWLVHRTCRTSKFSWLTCPGTSKDQQTLQSCTQIPLTYIERQKCYGPDKKILFKKTIIWPWGQSPTKVIDIKGIIFWKMLIWC